MTGRSYGDACGVARALDVIGERWALLVIRELLLGPKRFGDLHRGLGRMSQNVLAQRLRELEAAGVAERRRLGPPAGAWVYSLTERGAALEPVLVELGRWGRHRPVAAGAPLSLDAFALALRTTYAGGATGVRALLVGDGDAILVDTRDGELAVARGAPADVAVAAWADVTALRELAFGTLRVRDAMAAGDLQVEGDAAALQRLFDAIAPRVA